MKILAIETATRCQSVALLEDLEVLAERVQEDCSSHTRMLLPTIDELLRSLRLKLSNLDGLAVSMGPGSFTGLRVGLGTAMAMRLATGIPIVGVSTLEALTWNVRGVKGRICPMIRSRVGEVYWAQFEWWGEKLNRLSEDQVGSLEQCADGITETVSVLGDGWDTNKAALRDLLGSKANSVDPQQWRASAESVARASQQYFHAGNFLPIGVSPMYVHPSQAEVQWNERPAPGIENLASS